LTYDEEGRPTALIDAAGNTTRYGYDVFGRKVATRDPTGLATSTNYDVLGRKVQAVDREGVVSTFAYDALGRLLDKSIGGARTTYSYDGMGRIISAENADARVTTAYDLTNRPTQYATLPNGGSSPQSVSYAYDAAGRRSSMTYAGATQQYTYDGVGRLLSLVSPQVGTFHFEYDAAGRRTRLLRPNGVTTSYAYNSAGDPVSVIHANGGQMVDQSLYSYDAGGQRTQVKTYNGDHTYGYDQTGNVKSADHPGQQADESFTYDELGNRTSSGEEYDAANRLLRSTRWAYDYDREGRTTSRTDRQSGQSTTFTWRPDGRLGSVTSAEGQVTRYRYDPMGRRIETSEGGHTRGQVYGLDPNAVGETSDGVASAQFTFGLGFDEPLAQQRNGVATYFEQDVLSSVTSLSDSSGQITGRYSYNTYGGIAAATGAATSPYTFTGREYSAATSTFYYRDREYDPATGRFLTEDPVAASNAYVYADGNPVALNDPTGRFTLAETNGEMMLQQALISANVNLLVSVARCGGGQSAEKIGKSVGGGFLAGGLFGGTGAILGKWLAKKAAAAVVKAGVDAVESGGAAQALGLAALTYGAATMLPRAVLSKLSVQIDPEDPLGWMIGPLIAQTGAVAGAAGGVGAVVSAGSAIVGALVPWALSDDTAEDCA
jgi:RHS repeat-associated protein